MPPRMKKADQFTGIGIDRTQIRPLVPVATKTCQRQVVAACFTAVLSGNDMVRFVLMQGKSLGGQAILTTILGPIGNESP